MSTENMWVRIADPDEIPVREGRVLAVGDREIAVFNLGDRFLAVENRCPHRAGPLADGIVTGNSVVCPLHGWKINLQHGNVERPAETPACVKTFATRVEAGTLLLEVGSQQYSNCTPPNGRAAANGRGSSQKQTEEAQL